MKKFLSFLLLLIFFIFMAAGCGARESDTSLSSTSGSQDLSDINTEASGTSENRSVTFTDALGREVTVDAPERVGIASGSFAECWLLAGGTPTAVTQDALEERDLELPKDIINLGSVMRPSAEAILDADLDLLILASNMKNHVELAETLDKVGINYAYVNIETFDDYLNTLKIFTDITGRKDLYEQNGTAISKQIDDIIAESKMETAPKVLILRTSSSKITARNSDTMVGQMLKNLGCINIADAEDSLLEELSLEVIARENPEYIFVICHGEVEEAKANLENMMASNPIWNTLDAVKSDRLYYLEKELFHYKPNNRWAESYQVLAKIFAED